MTLHLLHSEFPYTVYEGNMIFFFFLSAKTASVVRYMLLGKLSQNCKLDSHGHFTLIEDGDGVPVVDEGRQLPQAVLSHQGQVVDAYQPTR
jgi:hypothetical protein